MARQFRSCDWPGERACPDAWKTASPASVCKPAWTPFQNGPSSAEPAIQRVVEAWTHARKIAGKLLVPCRRGVFAGESGRCLLGPGCFIRSPHCPAFWVGRGRRRLPEIMSRWACAWPWRGRFLTASLLISLRFVPVRPRSAGKRWCGAPTRIRMPRASTPRRAITCCCTTPRTSGDRLLLPEPETCGRFWTADCPSHEERQLNQAAPFGSPAAELSSNPHRWARFRAFERRFLGKSPAVRKWHAPCISFRGGVHHGQPDSTPQVQP